MITKTLWREKSSVVYTAAWAMVLSPLLYLSIVLSMGSDLFSRLAEALFRLDFNRMTVAFDGISSLYSIPLLSIFFNLLYLYGLTAFARLQEEADRRSLMLVRAATIVPVCISVVQFVLPLSAGIMLLMVILSLLAFLASNILAITGFGQLRRSVTFPEKGRAAAGLLRANSVWQLIGFGLVLMAWLVIYASISSARGYQDFENAAVTTSIMGVLMVIVIVVVTIVCVCLFLSGWATMHNVRPATGAASVEAGRVSIAGAPSGGMFAGAVALCVVMEIVWSYIYYLVWLWCDEGYDFESYWTAYRVLSGVQTLSYLIGWGLLLFAFVKVMGQKPRYRQACLWIVAACGLQLLRVLLQGILSQTGLWSTGGNSACLLLDFLAVSAFFAGLWQMNVVAENRLTALGARVLMGLMGLYVLGDLAGIVVVADNYDSLATSFCNSIRTAIPWMSLYLAIGGYRYLLSGLYGGGDLEPVAPSVASGAYVSPVPPVSPAPPVSRRPEYVPKAMTADIVPPTTTEATEPAPAFVPADHRASGSGKSSTGLVVGLCLLAVLLVGGALAYFLWYVPYAKDRDAERTYVYATNLFLRSEKLAGVEYNVTGKLPYGTELITYTRDAEWAEVKAGDKKGFVAAPYLMTRADFDLLDSAWGDAESREHIVTTKCRLAILDFYKSKSLTGGKGGWQVYSMGRDVKPNTVFYPRAYRKDSKYTDFFFIVHNNTTGDRMMAGYSFDDLTEEPIFRFCTALDTRASISAVTVSRQGYIQVVFSDGSRLPLSR